MTTVFCPQGGHCRKAQLYKLQKTNKDNNFFYYQTIKFYSILCALQIAIKLI